ncbi:Gtr1/RagA G protein conserved region-domain-containing protein, partial [Gigaspora rosea]
LGKSGSGKNSMRSIIFHNYVARDTRRLSATRDAKIFCLIHKMDLVQEELRTQVDETLYKAWSSIVHSLIPNVRLLESHLQNFATICEADEVVLFERTTFLVISHSTRIEHPDVHRFEKISNYMKQFKLSCSKAQAQFGSMEIRQANFAAFFDVLTTNTYVMVIMSDPTVEVAHMTR